VAILKKIGKVYTPKIYKKLSTKDKVMIKRRSTIEPIIEHLNKTGRMGRNYLKGSNRRYNQFDSFSTKIKKTLDKFQNFKKLLT
jgi:hypothetical protein